ncbi:isochorismate synthase MenF [Nosocomiicoccus sp. HMSC059G07]|uniref:isochorismate synthase n=1 Tax=Nosocomiicoccus sp. HMSC059G07 TaxID=1739531 RepID=UPI0008A5D639|nr:isochorismate synthase [Nosocomiicoccus sp. HMSC059G07]OFO53729.1 hypothetical protein HMPREF3029_05155 [Nosocomiicoccus sp. HMSC059G07]
MHIESSQSLIDEIGIDSNTSYLALHFSTKDFDITPSKIFMHFNHKKGERYWFKSREADINVIGVDYIDSINRKQFNADILNTQKNGLFNNIQHVKLNDGLVGDIHLFGGTRFDDKKTTDEWIDFKMVEFILASWQFDLHNQEAFLILKKEDLQTENLAELIVNTLRGIEVAEPRFRFPEISSHHEIYPKAWKALVDNTVDILDDDFEKVVLSRELLIRFENEIDPNFLINRLKVESDTFKIFYERGTSTFVSKTPEKLFYLKDEKLSTHAIAGSIRREDDDTVNEQNKKDFLNDEKNHFEHIVVRDSIVEDLKPYTCSVYYDDTRILENKFIYHLYTPIEATLNKESNLFDVLHALHPTPAVGGLPKDRALEYIKEKEYFTRGLYAAPIGVISKSNEAEFAVALRSMRITGKSATLYAGAGIVKGSTGESEYEETRTKFRPMLDVLEALE